MEISTREVLPLKNVPTVFTVLSGNVVRTLQSVNTLESVSADYTCRDNCGGGEGEVLDGNVRAGLDEGIVQADFLCEDLCGKKGNETQEEEERNCERRAHFEGGLLAGNR